MGTIVGIWGKFIFHISKGVPFVSLKTIQNRNKSKFTFTHNKQKKIVINIQTL